MVTPRLVTPLLILLTTTVSPCFGFSALNFDEEIHRVQQSGASCFLSLAEKNFDPFSTVAMVKTRTLYESTSKLAISTEDLILSKLLAVLGGQRGHSGAFSADQWAPGE